MTPATEVWHTEFLRMRNEWALRLMPGKDKIDRERIFDRNKNEYNEPHKPKLRSEAEIISDLSYEAADAVMSEAYRPHYILWLRETGFGKRS